jgi:putative spermidine/putrescine transport system permease protein
VVPLWTSYLIKAFAWLILLSKSGLLNSALLALGFIGEPKQYLYGDAAVLIGMVHMMVPIVVLVLLPVFDSIDKNLINAAGTLGAGKAHSFWLVYFPLSLPGVVSGALLAFLLSIGFFIVPVLLGGQQQTMIAQLIIDQVQMMFNWPFAGALAALLLIATVLACWLYDFVFGLSSLTGEANTESKGLAGRLRAMGLSVLYAIAAICKPFSKVAEILPGARYVLPGVALLILLFLLLPSLILVPLSFTSSNFLEFPLPGYSLKWVDQVWDSPTWAAAALRSARIGIAAALLATVLGALAAIGLARSSSRWAQPMFALFISPMIVPRIVIAVGLFYQFSSMGIVTSDIALIVGHTVLALPLAFITFGAVLKQYDWRLNQAAATLGAGWIRSFFYITAPLVKKGLAVAFLLAFNTSFDDLTIALFVSGGVNTTLPKEMWDSMLLQATPALAVVSSMVMLMVVILLVFGEFVLRRNGKRSTEDIEELSPGLQTKAA